ncbi:FAD-binding protein, partial [Salmonella enterica]|nr:FAD-binding protein [Salmonella enterica]
MKNNASRRRFIQLGFASATAGSLATLLPVQASAQRKSTDINWDEEMDILVVGTGMAGFTAAIRAAETTPGMKIVIADKMSRLGGSSLIS